MGDGVESDRGNSMVMKYPSGAKASSPFNLPPAMGKCVINKRDLWRRHRRKVLVTVGVLGSGYLLYKLYDAHKRRLIDLERQLANERENDEFIKAQMQLHFENIQRIADTTTLPHAMPHLSCRIAEDLNLSHLMERLVKGKDQPNRGQWNQGSSTGNCNWCSN
ncbi:hypothetical protein GOBAR_DD17750 [Gossypium barbadense]|nr:hypothetical protein GOBAR_DD17750 [Gossypium barbadense]